MKAQPAKLLSRRKEAHFLDKKPLDASFVFPSSLIGLSPTLFCLNLFHHLWEQKQIKTTFILQRETQHFEKKTTQQNH